MFTREVIDALQYYVYRLIDPRNGETFYIGKGIGNRVFMHVKGEMGAGEDDLNDKIMRIREIHSDGFEVAHVIHRHGLSEETALEVEATLIDAYPEADNIISGQGSDERGVMHSRQIIEKYSASEVVFKHNVVIISINKTAAERALYDAVRFAWKIDPKRASAADYVLAVRQGLIVGSYKADLWIEATPANFPTLPQSLPGRWGFVGHEAPPEIRDLYNRKRIPDALRRKGAANPVRYASP
jgi:hypothetical protein